MHVTRVSRCVFLRHKYDGDAALDYAGLFRPWILYGGWNDEQGTTVHYRRGGKKRNGNAEEHLARCGVRDIAGNFAFGSSDRYALMRLVRLIKGKNPYRVSLHLKSISAKETALHSHIHVYVCSHTRAHTLHRCSWSILVTTKGDISCRCL